MENLFKASIISVTLLLGSGLVSADVMVESGAQFEMTGDNSVLEFAHFNQYPDIKVQSDEVSLGVTNVSISSTGDDEVVSKLHWMDRNPGEGQDAVKIETLEGGHGDVSYSFEGIDLPVDVDLESDTAEVSGSFSSGDDIVWTYDSWSDDHNFTLVAQEDSDDNGNGDDEGGGTAPSDGFLLTGLPEGVATGLEIDLGVDPSENSQSGTTNVVFMDEGSGEFAGILSIDFTEDFPADSVSVEVDRGDRSSVITGGDSDMIEGRSLLVPREEDSGEVRVCPEASTLDEISEDCSDGFVVESGESAEGVANTEVELDGNSYYELSGVSGTGGVELEDSDENGNGTGASGGLPGDDDDEDEGDGDDDDRDADGDGLPVPQLLLLAFFLFPILLIVLWTERERFR